MENLPMKYMNNFTRWKTNEQGYLTFSHSQIQQIRSINHHLLVIKRSRQLRTKEVDSCKLQLVYIGEEVIGIALS